MNDPIDNLIEKLILMGAMEVAGVDSVTGEFLYGFTPKLKEIDPRLAEEVNGTIQNGILDLWADGFLDIDMNKKEPTVSLTEKCFDDIAVASLSDERQSFLRSIMERFRNQ